MASTKTVKKPQDRLVRAVEPPRPAVISIDADESDEIPVRLIGVDYTAHAPKGILALQLSKRVEHIDPEDVDALMAEVEEFVRLLFVREEAEAIITRLSDPDDLLDLRHIMKLVNEVTRLVAAGVPST